ncbi:WecB/TagA/CpsF family glycosyltransferase [Desulfuribacillus alkaliarsenatis]|uniref:N-acetylglucosaminyldiphosphoundecaprenol N-acetyl-beta-D-mannosaminyltransferase n=1 Tax=Desulfuribacillus alkaliarsenatis TaxID=766136 RepID=A0A1E5G3I8_9FIRM|nr:WecB/TagA/CpsF family glycosyltransferase [Desulfuribacillus alkaliarsenatis]OEF97654.1 hypothetical protein BHF68_14505 [Desulfuribacillus alkaliarsenatis]
MKELIPKVRILDIPFSVMGMDETVRYCDELIQSKTPHHIITANPEIVILAQENKELKDIIEAAQLVTCDGTGVVWATQYTDFPAKERVTGFDLTLQLFALCSEKNYSVYFVGAKPEVMEAAINEIKKQWPKLDIVGHHHGYFRVGDEQKTIEDIQTKKPEVLFVALGAPRQEFWISEHLKKLEVPLTIGVGGSFDVLSGTMKRAPEIWQRLHVEWLYRLIKQPSRWRRMLALPKFAYYVLKSKKISANTTK